MTAMPDPLSPWPAPDRRLLARMAAGDSAAARVLTRRLECTLYAIAYSVLFDPEQADAVVQEVMERAEQNAAHLRDTAVPVRHWLARLTRFLAAERARTRVD